MDYKNVYRCMYGMDIFRDTCGSGDSILHQRQYDQPVEIIQFSPDGTMFAFGYDDGIAETWGIVDC